MTSAVVTGAASGIGRALAAQLAAEGRKIYLADVAAMGEVVHETSGVAVTADVTRPDDMERLAETASDARLVCLNAGITGATMGPPWEAPFEEWERILRTNLLGVVNGLRAFVPRLLAADDPAHILITASLAGLITFPSGGAYAATKHAVIAVAEQTAMILRDSQVGVTVLCPALVRTGMSETGADPAAVAEIALQACRDGKFCVVDEAWKQAVIDRGAQLAGGVPPVPPTMEASS
jgi:NAD(P)-dependent dehydrogenase (short-subunit alcohol dehydrogenase family)